MVLKNDNTRRDITPMRANGDRATAKIGDNADARLPAARRVP